MSDADPPRVLVVDDDADQRFVVRRLLARAGIPTVYEAADGDEALEVARREQPDLVVLDLAMPGRSGVDVLPELREVVGQAPIVVLSNLTRRRWEAEVLQRGAVGFVEKRTPNDRLIGDVLAMAELLHRLGDRLGLDLAKDPAAPGAARRFVRSSLTDIDDAALDAVELLTSELVTNAVIHAGSEPHLVLVLHPDRVRIEVHDTDPRMPARRKPDEARPGGRGLLLLDQVASDWGVEPLEGGKVVWFEVPRRGDGKG
jgi:CheY-like chemotaxis protein